MTENKRVFRAGDVLIPRRKVLGRYFTSIQRGTRLFTAFKSFEVISYEKHVKRSQSCAFKVIKPGWVDCAPDSDNDQPDFALVLAVESVDNGLITAMYIIEVFFQAYDRIGGAVIDNAEIVMTLLAEDLTDSSLFTFSELFEAL